MRVTIIEMRFMCVGHQKEKKIQTNNQRYGQYDGFVCVCVYSREECKQAIN